MYYRRKEEIAKYNKYISCIGRGRGVYGGIYKNPETGVLQSFSYNNSETRKLCNRTARRKMKDFDSVVPPSYFKKMSDYKWKII